MQSSARYIGPDTAAIERHWQVDRDNAWRGGELFPRSPGVLIRAARYSAEPERELRVGQWGLVKEARLGYSTVNTRFEEITSNPSYKDPWRYGKRWIIPAWGAWRTELGVKLQRHQFVVIKSCVPAEQNRNDGPTDLFEVGPTKQIRRVDKVTVVPHVEDIRAGFFGHRSDTVRRSCSCWRPLSA